jgi:hypothetical protein
VSKLAAIPSCLEARIPRAAPPYRDPNLSLCGTALFAPGRWLDPAYGTKRPAVADGGDRVSNRCYCGVWLIDLDEAAAVGYAQLARCCSLEAASALEGSDGLARRTRFAGDFARRRAREGDWGT